VRLVLDTNAIVSGLLWRGPPHALLEVVRQGESIFLYSSPPLLGELADVLSRGKLSAALALAGLSPERLLQDYLRVVHVVTPAAVSPVIRADPDDDHVLARALSAQVDLIVSGDSHLLNLKTYHGIPIVRAAEALERLAAR